VELGGGRGAVALPQLAAKGGKWYQMPPPFCRLKGMMPASTEKNIGLCW